jgi:hypothetical protein
MITTIVVAIAYRDASSFFNKKAKVKSMVEPRVRSVSQEYTLITLLAACLSMLTFNMVESKVKTGRYFKLPRLTKASVFKFFLAVASGVTVSFINSCLIVLRVSRFNSIEEYILMSMQQYGPLRKII